MGKPNTYLQLLNAQKQIQQLLADIERMKGFTLQQSLDMALITLNQHFGFGPDRCAKFETAFRETFLDYAQMCVDDSKDDAQIVYAPENLYLRDRNLKGD